MTFLKKVSRPIPCPICKEIGLEIHERLVATTGALAGVQTKFPARQALFLACPHCWAETEGSIVFENGAPRLNVDMTQMKIPEK